MRCALEYIQGLGALGRGLCPVILCQQGQDGFESSVGRDRSGLSLGLWLFRQPLPDFSQEP